MKSALFVQANVALNTKLTSKVPFLFGNFDVFKKIWSKTCNFSIVWQESFSSPPPAMSWIINSFYFEYRSPIRLRNNFINPIQSEMNIFVPKSEPLLPTPLTWNLYVVQWPASYKHATCNAVYLEFGFLSPRAANYCRTSDNVRLNLANVRAKVILIGHWSDHKKKLSHYTFFCCDKIRLQIHSICILQ
jgi:hypothetical protein